MIDFKLCDRPNEKKWIFLFPLQVMENDSNWEIAAPICILVSQLDTMTLSISLLNNILNTHNRTARSGFVQLDLQQLSPPATAVVNHKVRCNLRKIKETICLN